MSKKSLLLLSGGMDSAVLLAKGSKDNQIAATLSFRYGSKHSDNELKCARDLAASYSLPHTIFDLDFVDKHFQSSLLQKGDPIPTGDYTLENMKSTVVPFRNGIMLSCAVGYAESLCLESVWLASHSGDHLVYPDCTPAFTTAFAKAAISGTHSKIMIEAPFSELSKFEIAALAKELGVDISKTWTCYNGLQKQCGSCPACKQRRQAAKEAGLIDNTVYLNHAG